MKKTVLATIITLGAMFGIASAVPSPKYFVCKYVGTPGVNESLQTGQNPISVSGNAITPPVVIGAYFNDSQGRSYVVAEDTGQPEPSCPTPQTPPVVPPTTPPVTPPTTTQTTSSTQTTSIPEAPLTIGGK